ncbi:hypothetical protein HMPREF0201_04482 [Cedecea davisae DSM 4568]|uniref:Uncharacterized protein n=1 Tax=Cedecea davisae DSM 4568 TaxID=566551 RepID=S3JI60_9ENTR|nr:hypothetical protein HMPREF0201_04482 [Cedecea davisae DSM 4568]
MALLVSSPPGICFTTWLTDRIFTRYTEQVFTLSVNTCLFSPGTYTGITSV